MKINIYDFDKTIIPFDSGSKFFGYCLLHYPYLLLLLPFAIPVFAVATALRLLHIISFTDFKGLLFSFVPLIPVDRAVKGFWDKYESSVNSWFYDRQGYTVVISASPDFLLCEIADRLNFDKLICTRHNRKTGRIIGKNCRDGEKVNRLYQEFGKDNIQVVNVYSDSLNHDKPIFSLGKNCFHIVDGRVIPFDFNEAYKD